MSIQSRMSMIMEMGDDVSRLSPEEASEQQKKVEQRFATRAVAALKKALDNLDDASDLMDKVDSANMGSGSEFMKAPSSSPAKMVDSALVAVRDAIAKLQKLS